MLYYTSILVHMSLFVPENHRILKKSIDIPAGVRMHGIEMAFMNKDKKRRCEE